MNTNTTNTTNTTITPATLSAAIADYIRDGNGGVILSSRATAARDAAIATIRAAVAAKDEPAVRAWLDAPLEAVQEEASIALMEVSCLLALRECAESFTEGLYKSLYLAAAAGVPRHRMLGSEDPSCGWQSIYVQPADDGGVYAAIHGRYHGDGRWGGEWSVTL